MKQDWEVPGMEKGRVSSRPLHSRTLTWAGPEHIAGNRETTPVSTALPSRGEQSGRQGLYRGSEMLRADRSYQTTKCEASHPRALRDGDFQWSPPPWAFTRVLEIPPHWPLHQCSQSQECGVFNKSPGNGPRGSPGSNELLYFYVECNHVWS